ncbi:MAG TPA: hypothetical protein VJG90_01545 [Candidatus Nanoarchaeia archaeon]|nr:hypothetical protein [Candidatus Nanoarchaeia archaeon]
MVQLRVVFDTNVYGFLLKELDQLELEKAILSDKDFLVFGFQPVRKELRAIQKDKDAARKARILLLGLYDRIVKDRLLENSNKIMMLAKEYFKQYRGAKGSKSWDEIGVDFLIVACATIKNMDVVCSGDERTLMCDRAQLIYAKVNILAGYRGPNFWPYTFMLNRFRKKLK